VDMTPVASLERLVGRDFVASLRCPRDHRRKVIDDKSRMSLSGGNKILLNAEMDLQIPAFKPAAATGGQLWRLQLFIGARDAMIEGSRLVLATGGHGNQNVVDTAHWHLLPHGPRLYRLSARVRAKRGHRLRSRTSEFAVIVRYP